MTRDLDSGVKSEIFAEDIEALLARLVGVAGARVVATEAGEIDRIFVTSFADYDPTTIRRTIMSALMSEYGLSIAGWRIHVARLRIDEPSPPPALSLSRIQETLSGSQARLVVELQAADGTARLLGSANGAADAQGRVRLAAEATLHALRPVLVTEERKAQVEDITTIRLAGGLVVVAAVAVIESGATTTAVGAAVVAAGAAEAAVAATLDAMAKRGTQQGRRGGWGMKDRREQLEALRSDYRRLRGAPGPDPPSTTGAAGVDDTSPEGSATAPEDTTRGLSDIRPERRGGATMDTRAGDQRQAAGPRRSMEDDHFRGLVERRAPVEITCRDGYEIRGIILDVGTYSLMVQSPAGRELLFKHAIISVRESHENSDS